MRTKLTAITIPGQKEAYVVETIDGNVLGTIARYSRSSAWSVVACTKSAAIGKHLGTCYSKDGAKFMLTEHYAAQPTA